MNILITGVHGFVGSNLVKALSSNNIIYGLDIVTPEKEGVAKTFSWDELPQLTNMQINAVIHLAGKAHDTHNKSAADIYFKVNTGLTQKIFDWYMANPTPKKFIFFSTVKSVADHVPGDILTEECVPTSVGPYGESKVQAENHIIQSFAPAAMERPFHNFSDADVSDSFKVSDGSNKQVYIMRPCMIHGPGNKGNLNLLYGVVKKGIPWPLGAFENRRSFTCIDNLCYVINGLLTKDVESGIYHMGDDEALSTNELIELICEALGKKAHIWHLPKGLMNGMSKLGGWCHLPLNPLRMQKLTENYVVSNDKIKKALGVDKMPVRANEGIMKTVRSFTIE
ncbi:NAD-dependent epimerase/dehydratase family protein [Bacteroides fragilis]|uniref:NAD-dependent epimerase/dehydratase family protein n=1 Tax=Bacteroides fragilis TaxID=817 RepID=UPI00202DFD90|nr:NAD-dependent epimerase/dehydratase family protein [Bacteroides fragilis]MCM0343132.1 NAD-dependent epimerase/dehydratase family protein [Bacteroides fragilis]